MLGLCLYDTFLASHSQRHFKSDKTSRYSRTAKNCVFILNMIITLNTYSCEIIVNYSLDENYKGSDLFQNQRAGQTMKKAAGRGTSRYPIGIKSWPEVIVNWILMKIVFFCHFISYLWQKIAIVLAIFGHFLRLFSASDTVMLKRGAHSTWIYLTHVRSRIQAILGPLSHSFSHFWSFSQTFFLPVTHLCVL